MKPAALAHRVSTAEREARRKRITGPERLKARVTLIAQHMTESERAAVKAAAGDHEVIGRIGLAAEKRILAGKGPWNCCFDPGCKRCLPHRPRIQEAGGVSTPPERNPAIARVSGRAPRRFHVPPPQVASATTPDLVPSTPLPVQAPEAEVVSAPAPSPAPPPQGPASPRAWRSARSRGADTLAELERVFQ